MATFIGFMRVLATADENTHKSGTLRFIANTSLPRTQHPNQCYSMWRQYGSLGAIIIGDSIQLFFHTSAGF